MLFDVVLILDEVLLDDDLPELDDVPVDGVEGVVLAGLPDDSSSHKESKSIASDFLSLFELLELLDCWFVEDGFLAPE